MLKAMIYRHMLEMTRYPITILSSFATLIMLTFIFLFAARTFTTGSATGVVDAEREAIIGGLMMYGFIIYLFTSDTLWSIGYNVRMEQYAGTLESLYLTPASRFLYLISRMAYPMIWTTLNVSITLGCVWLIVGALPTENLFLALGVFGLTLSGIFGLGCCLAALTLLLKETAQIIANLFQFLLLFLCAIVVPFQSLPDQIQIISRFIPLSYCVDLFRSALLGFPPGFPELTDRHSALLIVLLWALLMPLLGYIAYRMAERHVRIRGTLAEF